MDIDRFITLQTVVEEGSFARAANKLCCTQSTVTYHIKELEQELSVQLFEKIGRRMLLTDAGRTVLPLSRELTQAVEHIRRALRPGDWAANCGWRWAKPCWPTICRASSAGSSPLRRMCGCRCARSTATSSWTCCSLAERIWGYSTARATSPR